MDRDVYRRESTRARGFCQNPERRETLNSARRPQNLPDPSAAPVKGDGGGRGFVQGVTVKLVALEAVPPGVATVIFPVVAPAGTVAVILVAVLSVNVAATPLKVTAEALLKVLPLMTTLVPTRPEVGVKLVI